MKCECGGTIDISVSDDLRTGCFCAPFVTVHPCDTCGRAYEIGGWPAFTCCQEAIYFGPAGKLQPLHHEKSCSRHTESCSLPPDRGSFEPTSSP